jgi:hypothetical protein
MYISNDDLIREIRDRTGYTLGELKFIIGTMKDLVYDHVRKCDEVKLFEGLGIRGDRLGERMVRNPKENCMQRSEPITRIKVLVSRSFRDYVR